MIIISLLTSVTAADFLAGLVHWAEDAYARPGLPLVDKIARENLEHHARPRAFVKKSWLSSSWDLLMLGTLILGTAALTHHLNSWLVLFVVLTVNANQIHKWAHSNRQETPRFIRNLQQWQILQGPRQHGKHHAGERNSHYCVITNYLNPVLESVGFWNRLEAVILRVTGVKRRKDSDYEALG